MSDSKSALRSVATRVHLKELGERLRRIRTARGLTQDELAKDAFSKSYLSAVELGKIEPSTRALRILAGRLQIPLAQLLNPGDNSLNNQNTGFALAQARLALELKTPPACSDALQTLETLANSDLSAAQQGEIDYLAACCLAVLEQDAAALEKLQAARLIWESLNFKEWVVRLNNLTGEIYRRQNRLIEARAVFETNYAALKAGHIWEPMLKLSVLNNLLSFNMADKNNSANQALLDEALHLLKALEDPALWIEKLQIMAAQYAAEGDFVHAQISVERALGLAYGLANLQLIVQTYLQLGKMQVIDNQLTTAQAYYQAAIGNSMWRWRNPLLAQVYAQLARVYLQQQQLPAALAALTEAETVLQDVLADDATVEKAWATVLLVKINLAERQKQPALADTIFKEAEARLQKLNDNNRLSDAYFEYGTVLLERGNTSEAHQYLKKAYELRS